MTEHDELVTRCPRLSLPPRRYRAAGAIPSVAQLLRAIAKTALWPGMSCSRNACSSGITGPISATTPRATLYATALWSGSIQPTTPNTTSMLFSW